MRLGLTFVGARQAVIPPATPAVLVAEMVLLSIPGKPQAVFWEDPTDIGLPIFLPSPPVQNIAGEGVKFWDDRGVLYVGKLVWGGHHLCWCAGIPRIHPVADHPADAGLLCLAGDATSFPIENLSHDLYIQHVVPLRLVIPITASLCPLWP